MCWCYRRADFTPFIVSMDGVIHREAEHFLKRLAARLADKWLTPYGQVMYFIRARLSLATLRATVHCVRGNARRWPAYTWMMEQPCPSWLSDSSWAYFYFYSLLRRLPFPYLHTERVTTKYSSSSSKTNFIRHMQLKTCVGRNFCGYLIL